MEFYASKSSNKVAYDVLWGIDYKDKPYLRVMLTCFSYYDNEAKKNKIRFVAESV